MQNEPYEDVTNDTVVSQKKILIAKAVNSTFLEIFSEYIGIGPELRKEFKICVEVRISFVPIFIFALNHFFFF